MLATSAQSVYDPAFRIRMKLPAPALAAHGVALDLVALFSSDQSVAFRAARPARKAIVLARARAQLGRRLTNANETAGTVVVQRFVDLVPSLALERAATKNRRIIYDVDDAVWLSGRSTGGHPLSALKGASRKVRWLATRAEHVIAGNEILAEYLSAYNDAVTVVPSLVDPGAYDVRRHAQSESVTLGWIGSPTTAPYLQGIAPLLERFASLSPRPVRLIIVGGAAPQVEGLRVEQRAWSPEAERQALAEMDIGLMPLRDTPWTRGKCAYKALQYMAAGIPPLVDDVGVSAITVKDAGIVASSEGQWLEALQSLTDDAELRARLGATGRERVERHFSLERWVPRLAQILRGDGGDPSQGGAHRQTP